MISFFLVTVLGTANFPAALAAASGGPVPNCDVCHQGVQSRGTVTTPFGTAMRERGLMAYDEASLRAAWAKMGNVESDGDGITDVDEIKAGQNPNVSETSFLVLPEYGCSTSLGGLGLWALGAWLVRRLQSPLPRSGRGSG